MRESDVLTNAGDGPTDEGTKGQIRDLHRNHTQPLAALGGNERSQGPGNDGCCHAAERDGIRLDRPVHRQTEHRANQQA